LTDYSTSLVFRNRCYTRKKFENLHQWFVKSAG